MVRKILIGAGVMVAVILIAAIALVTLVDVNRFKPQIEQYVQDRYQRSLRIDGDLGLSLFPRIALSLPPSTLSEQGGTGQAASLSSAKVGVAVMPLLRGEIVADKVTIDGLQARVERSADGRLSIDDLFAPQSPQAAAPAAPPSASPSSAVPGASAPSAGKLSRFEIGGIELSNARVVFADRQAGNTITIDGLDVNAGRIADKVTTPLTLKLKFASIQPQASGELSLKGGANLDVDQNVFGATDLDATLRATLELSGSQSLEARIEAAGIGGSSRALTVAKLTADALMRQGERT
nr:AsmA family protein [Lautropia sp.]